MEFDLNLILKKHPQQIMRNPAILSCLRKRKLLKKKSLKLFLLLSVAASAKSRQVWCLPKTDAWWETVVSQFTDKEWKANFRIGKKTYHFLCESMCYLNRKDNSFRKAIATEKRIAIAIYALSSSAEYRTVANVFGVGKSSVCEIVNEFTEQFVVQFQNKFISLPASEEEVALLVDSFYEAWGFPQCIGAIDGTHIHVQPPKEVATSYYNYKQFYSIVILAVVDYAYRFLYINVGSPGRNNDAHIFDSSSMKSYLTSNQCLWDLAEHTTGLKVPVCLVGDSAFPLMQTLQRPFYQSGNLTDIETNYNYRLSRGRRVVENAFGRLKARFRILKNLESKIPNAITIIQSTCILNNVCELFGDTIDPSSVDEEIRNLVGDLTINSRGNRNLPREIRETTAAFLYNNRFSE